MKKETTARIMKCPGCGKGIVYSQKNPHRPFCSALCKDNDIIAWAEQSYRIDGNPPQTADELIELEIELEKANS